MIVLGFVICNSSIAQGNLLMAEGTSPDLYISHVVTPKENYYSVGRLYNFSPKEIAAYNKLEFEKGLSLGQTIKIPLKENNFLQGTAPSKDEALIPVYHTVQAKEGLYRVSVTHNKVPLDLLKKWNNFPGDAVSSGTKLIIGYLKVIKDQSPLASQSVKVNTDVAVKIPEDKKPDKKQVVADVVKKDTAKLQKIIPVIIE